MDENAINDMFRMWALELLVSFQYSAMHLQTPNPMESLEMMRTGLIERSRNQTFPTLDPAMSDLAAGKLEDALNRLFEMQKTIVNQTRPPTS